MRAVFETKSCGRARVGARVLLMSQQEESSSADRGPRLVNDLCDKREKGIDAAIVKRVRLWRTWRPKPAVAYPAIPRFNIVFNAAV